jgi:hypothetical protein
MRCSLGIVEWMDFKGKPGGPGYLAVKNGWDSSGFFPVFGR